MVAPPCHLKSGADTTEQERELTLCGGQVVLWLNKIGPFHNPQETYPYYSLPFCKPDIPESELATSQAGIGEALEGNQLVDSGMKIEFPKNTKGVATLCVRELTKEDTDIFKYAVSQHYW